jgi:hypothetical protein
MTNADDILLDRLIANLQEVRVWKDKPRELKIEIASLKAECETARAELKRVRAELNDPSQQAEARGCAEDPARD